MKSIFDNSDYIRVMVESVHAFSVRKWIYMLGWAKLRQVELYLTEHDSYRSL